MRWSDQLRSVRHTFAQNRVRAALTLLGVTIGAGSIVLLAGLLRGGEEALIMTSHRASEADLVQVQNEDPPSSQMQKTQRRLSRGDAQTLDASPLLGSAPAASEAQRDVWLNEPMRKRVRLVGAGPTALQLYRLELDKGRFLSEEDLQQRRRVCVVGQRLWQELFQGRAQIDGARLLLEGHLFSIIGVLAKKPLLNGGEGGFWTWNGKIVLPSTTFDAVFMPSHEADRVYVRLGEARQLGSKIKLAEGVIAATLLRRHHGVQNFKIEGDDSEQKQERLILSIIKLLLLGTGLLSLFVGGINIMNVMLVTVTERTREIGVRRALGATPAAIRTQFLIEAAFIALTGGALGVCCGVFLSWLAAQILTRVVGHWNLHVEAWSIAVALGLSLGTGIGFGLTPALRASRCDPVEALRYE